MPHAVTRILQLCLAGALLAVALMIGTVVFVVLLGGLAVLFLVQWLRTDRAGTPGSGLHVHTRTIREKRVSDGEVIIEAEYEEVEEGERKEEK